MTLEPILSSRAIELPLGAGENALRFRALRSEASETITGPAPRSVDEWVAVATARPVDPARRAAFLDAVRSEWGALDLSEAARRSVELLEDPATRIVIAGQQPALWGGPLMLTVKALATIETAAMLTEAGVPAVPLFWIASEDHDVGELWGGSVPPRPGESGGVVDLAVPFSKGRRMFDTLRYEHPAETRFAGVAPLIASAPEPVRALFRASLAADPCTEFQNLFAALLGPRGLLPVRPEWLRTLAHPLITAELESPGATAALVRTQIEALEAHDLPVPIPEPADLPFFWIDDDGARHRLSLEDSDGEARVRIGGKQGPTRPLADFRADVAGHPERVSPDALLRPLIQDTLLQPTATLLGPTELAYQWELGEVYRARGLQRPVLVPRPRVRVVGSDDAATLAAHAIDPAALTPTATAATLVPSPRAAEHAATLEEKARPFIELIEAWSNDDKNDSALQKRTGRLARRLRDDVEKLAAVLPERAGTDVVEARRTVDAALARIFPGGGEGERKTALLAFLTRFGLDGIDALAPHLRPADGALVSLVLNPIESTAPVDSAASISASRSSDRGTSP